VSACGWKVQAAILFRESAGPRSSDPHATMSASPEPMDLINADEYHEQANQVKDTRVSSPRSASVSLVTRPQHHALREVTEHTHEERMPCGGVCVGHEPYVALLLSSTQHCTVLPHVGSLAKSNTCVSHEKRACVLRCTRLACSIACLGHRHVTLTLTSPSPPQSAVPLLPVTSAHRRRPST
jgi:hypothetical protein